MLATVAHTLDRVRSPMLGAVLGRSAVLRGVAADRRARLAIGGGLAIAIAAVMSVAAPGTWFVWAPLVLGVPHVLADVRYLLLGPYRPIALRRRDAMLAVGLLAIAAVTSPALGAAVVLGAVAMTPVTNRRSFAAALVAAGGLMYAASAWPIMTAYALLHGHNLVALGALALVTRERGVVRGLAIGALAITAVMLSGALDAILPMATLDGLAGYVLPDAAFARWPAALCARVALSFLFLQGVHYAVWLRLIPAAARPHGGLRGFGASLRALQRDCSAPMVGLAVGLVIALPVLALAGASEPEVLRERYLQLAGGHAYLELAVVMRWLAARP